MVMWGLNKNQSGKARALNVDLNEIGYQKDSTPLPHLRKVKGFSEYTEKEFSYYDSIIREFEPDNRINMIHKLTKLGFPVSFVVGYYDIDIEDMERLRFGRSEMKIVKNHLFHKYLRGKVLLLSVDNEEVTKLKNVVGEQVNTVIIGSIDDLIMEIEKDTGEMTIILTGNLPADIKDNIDLLVSNLEMIEGIYFIEIGTKGYFHNSLKLSSMEEMDVSDVYEKDVTKEEIETRIEEVVNEESVEVKSNVEIHNEMVKSPVKEIETKNDKVIIINDEMMNSKLKELEEELALYKKMYAEKILELDDVKKKLESFKKELEVKNKWIEEDLSVREKELKEQLDELKRTLEEKNNEIRSLKSLKNLLEKDLSQLREDYSALEIDTIAQKELLFEKKKEIDQLNEKIEQLEKEKEDILEELLKQQEESVDPSVVEELKDQLSKKDVEIDNLNEQIRRLRIELKKEIEDKDLLKKEYDDLQESYKELLIQTEQSVDRLDEVVLDDSVKSQIFYFKVVNQPPYFKSFMENLVEILKEKYKILVILLRETDEISEIYFKDIKKIATLDDVDEKEDVTVWLKPSKLMFTKGPDFYNKYDYMIVIDYLKTQKRYVKGDCVIPIYCLMNEREREVLGIKGMILSGGEQSIVDLRYDSKFELAKTSFIRKKYVQKKVSDWLKTMGIL